VQQSTRQTPSIRQAAPYVLILALGPFGAWAAIHLGLAVGSAACDARALAILLLLAPLAEEAVFRLGVQRWLQARLPSRTGYLSRANLLTAVLFGGLHALHQGAPLMALTLLPALVCGWVWEQSAQRLRYPVLVHCWYNLCLVLPSCL
jgi:membrane protease YdiL (CAAX protease family)